MLDRFFAIHDRLARVRSDLREAAWILILIATHRRKP